MECVCFLRHVVPCKISFSPLAKGAVENRCVLDFNVPRKSCPKPISWNVFVFLRHVLPCKISVSHLAKGAVENRCVLDFNVPRKTMPRTNIVECVCFFGNMYYHAIADLPHCKFAPLQICPIANL